MGPRGQKRESPRDTQPIFKVPLPQTPTTSNAYTHTSNSFSPLNPDVNLSESDDDMSLYSTFSTTSKRPKLNRMKNVGNSLNATQKQPTKPPPINIKGMHSHRDAINFLTDIRKNPNDFEFKFIPNGTRVLCSNNEAYKALKEKLQKTGSKFFTHLLREEQTTKIVLHGLYSMETTELMQLLNEINVNPTAIKSMSIHQKKYADHCVYLLYFKKDDKVKISVLRDIKSINYVRVRWEYYSNRRKGPIQCSRCMQYGHGASGCFLDPLCVRCGENHLSRDCLLLKNPETLETRTRIPDELLKCGLCGQNHSANFSQCEKRIEFIERQQIYRSRTQRRPRQTAGQQNQNQRRFVTAPQLQNSNFPNINPSNAANGQAWTNNNNSIPNHYNNQFSSSSTGLFNSSELMTIFKELMTNLSQAKSPEQQIYALGEVVIKYCNGRST